MKNRIKELRQQKGITQSVLARYIGVAQNTLSYWEQGKYDIDNVSLKKIAEYFSVSIDYLLGRSDERIDESVLDIVNEIDDDILESSEGNLLWAQKAQGARDIGLPTNIIPLPVTKEIPLLGTIACGEPVLAEENIDMYVTVGSAVPADFALKCKGDSMINSRIYDGDVVYIRSQPNVEDGEIAAVVIGDEATLKKVYKYPNKLVLRASNPMYDDLIYTDEQLNEIRILGKAVGFFSVIR